MTSVPRPIPSHKEAEALLASLAGVVSAHVVFDPAGVIVEIHILSSPDLHPKQVVRNVESALSAGLGISIDRRIVSVAQIRTPDASGAEGDQRNGLHTPEAAVAPAPDEPGPAASDVELRRLEYVRYHAHRQADGCTCEVVLRAGGEEIIGSGTGPDTAGGRAEAAARAVVDAVGRARPELRVVLDGAAISSSRGRTFVIVAAHLIAGRETLRLAGAAPLSRSPEEAAILATLQATNRWSA